MPPGDLAATPEECSRVLALTAVCLSDPSMNLVPGSLPRRGAGQCLSRDGRYQGPISYAKGWVRGLVFGWDSQLCSARHLAKKKIKTDNHRYFVENAGKLVLSYVSSIPTVELFDCEDNAQSRLTPVRPVSPPMYAQPNLRPMAHADWLASTDSQFGIVHKIREKIHEVKHVKKRSTMIHPLQSINVLVHQDKTCFNAVGPARRKYVCEHLTIPAMQYSRGSTHVRGVCNFLDIVMAVVTITGNNGGMYTYFGEIRSSVKLCDINLSLMWYLFWC